MSSVRGSILTGLRGTETGTEEKIRLLKPMKSLRHGFRADVKNSRLQEPTFLMITPLWVYDAVHEAGTQDFGAESTT